MNPWNSRQECASLWGWEGWHRENGIRQVRQVSASCKMKQPIENLKLASQKARPGKSYILCDSYGVISLEAGTECV